MKLILRFLLTCVITLAFVLPNKSKACHLAAADIYVTYVGEGADGCSNPDYKYEVTLIIYYACQDCFNPGNGPQQVQYQSESLGFGIVSPGNPAVTVRLDTFGQAPDTVHSLCGQFSDSNSCILPEWSLPRGTPLPDRAANFPGYQKRIYRNKTPLTLPGPAPDWKFSWSSGVRNRSINLIGQDNLYVEAGLNNVTKYNNSTPRFTSNPLPYICINQPFTYLNSPFDPNGDSINVVQQNAHSAAAGLIQYATLPPPASFTFSNADPIYSAPSNPYNLNLYTGAATFTPQYQGMYVLAFRATDYEYGTGILLSYVYRDVQVAVLPCNAPPPDIDTLSRTATTVSNATIVKSKTMGDAVFVCPGSNMNISLSTKSPNQGGKIYMYANTEMFQGSTFSAPLNGNDSVVGSFNWTPDESKVGQHTLVITSKDSTCLISQPIVLVSYRVILVNVVKGLDAGPDVRICEFNPKPVPLYVTGAEDLRVKWTLDGGPAIGISNDAIPNPILTTTQNASYVISTPDLAGACKASDTIRTIIDPGDGVRIFPQNPVDSTKALVMCRPGYLQLEAFPRGPGRKDNINCGITPIKECDDEKTSTVYGSTLLKEIVYDSLSKYAFDLDNKVRTAKMQYLVHRHEMQKSDIWASALSGITLSVKGGDNPNYRYSNFKILIKCTEKEELDATEGFEDAAGLTEVYSASEYFFTEGDHTFPFAGTHYNWDTSKNLIVQMYYDNNQYVDTCGGSDKPSVFRYVNTAYGSSLFLKPGKSPTNPAVPDSTVLSVVNVTTSDDIKLFQTRPLTSFTYCEVPGLPFVMTWIYGNQIADSTMASTLAYVPSSAHFVAETIGRSGCKTRDTLFVYVPEHDFKVVPDDTSICLGDKAPLLVYGGHFFKWYEYENGQYLDPKSVSSPKSNYTFIGPDKTTEYRIVVSDSVFCYDTISARVRVMPLPDVRILNDDDTTVKYGQSFQLLASGARFYNWSPVSSLNNPNISYPIARPTEDTKYIVGGIGANGCRSFDTLHVIVDKRDNLFVPSAFSPNGDGRNDVFRITNLSFQRIMEFRVFNRWGQEVYSTNDSRAGWDGTWGGVPQDMGVYTYLIRVAYPDGFVETYRGETSLIR